MSQLGERAARCHQQVMGRGRVLVSFSPFITTAYTYSFKRKEKNLQDFALAFKNWGKMEKSRSDLCQYFSQYYQRKAKQN